MYFKCRFYFKKKNINILKKKKQGKISKKIKEIKNADKDKK
jgi:hypothetical protein